MLQIDGYRSSELASLLAVVSTERACRQPLHNNDIGDG
jgi:hypothetical protein